MQYYLAHAGVEHATEAEAANHAGGSYNWPVIGAMTLVVVFAVLVTVKLMSLAEQPDKPDSKERSK